MRRPVLLPLAGLDDQCATHHFIRVHGRRPTQEELAACLRTRGAAHRAGVAGLLGRLRCQVARLLA